MASLVPGTLDDLDHQRPLVLAGQRLRRLAVATVEQGCASSHARGLALSSAGDGSEGLHGDLCVGSREGADIGWGVGHLATGHGVRERALGRTRLVVWVSGGVRPRGEAGGAFGEGWPCRTRGCVRGALRRPGGVAKCGQWEAKKRSAMARRPWILAMSSCCWRSRTMATCSSFLSRRWSTSDGLPLTGSIAT